MFDDVMYYPTLKVLCRDRPVEIENVESLAFKDPFLVIKYRPEGALYPSMVAINMSAILTIEGHY